MNCLLAQTINQLLQTVVHLLLCRYDRCFLEKMSGNMRTSFHRLELTEVRQSVRETSSSRGEQTTVGATDSCTMCDSPEFDWPVGVCVRVTWPRRWHVYDTYERSPLDVGSIRSDRRFNGAFHSQPTSHCVCVRGPRQWTTDPVPLVCTSHLSRDDVCGPFQTQRDDETVSLSQTHNQRLKAEMPYLGISCVQLWKQPLASGTHRESLTDVTTKLCDVVLQVLELMKNCIYLFSVSFSSVYHILWSLTCTSPSASCSPPAPLLVKLFISGTILLLWTNCWSHNRMWKCLFTVFFCKLVFQRSGFVDPSVSEGECCVIKNGERIVCLCVFVITRSCLFPTSEYVHAMLRLFTTANMSLNGFIDYID